MLYPQENGLLFQFEGKKVGTDQFPRELLGIYGEKEVRFWTSYLRPGELFFWKGGWFKVLVNRLEDFGNSQKYFFFAVPVSDVRVE